jgi:hypothetical protein
VLEVLLESEVLPVVVPFTALVLCACRLAIKLCMNCCMAAAMSWLFVLEEEELLDAVPEVELELLVLLELVPVPVVLLAPVTPT